MVLCGSLWLLAILCGSCGDWQSQWFLVFLVSLGGSFAFLVVL